MQATSHYPLEAVAADLNTVAAFLALRGEADAPDAEPDDAPADLIVLLGNSVLATAQRAFAAMRAGKAPLLLIAGGRGHSTRHLEDALRNAGYGRAVAAGGCEAEMLAVLAHTQGIAGERMLLETASTNCGENASFALRTIERAGIAAARLVLMQDPTMQRRSDATFRKVWRDAGRATRFVNDPTFVPQLALRDGALGFVDPVPGCWPVTRFASLALGEIVRLRDDEAGYGPAGRGLIAHVDIPAQTEAAHARLAQAYPDFVRPLWTSDTVS